MTMPNKKIAVVACVGLMTALLAAQVKAADLPSEVGEAGPLIQMHVGGVHTSLIYNLHSAGSGSDFSEFTIDDSGLVVALGHLE